MLKVGDRVTILPKPWNFAQDLRDKTATVVSISPYGVCGLQIDGMEDLDFWSEEHLKLIEEEQAMFKIGDRVIMRPKSPLDEDTIQEFDGEKATVLNVFPFGVCEIQNEIEDEPSLWHQDYLELDKKQPMFRVGYKVKSNPTKASNGIDWERFKKGELVAYCETVEDARTFLQQVQVNNMPTQPFLAIEELFNTHEELCFRVYDQRVFCSEKSYYQQHGFEIVAYKAQVNTLEQFSNEELLNEIQSRLNSK